MNVRELKELLKDLPDDMQVESCCDCGGEDGTQFLVKESTTSYDGWETEVEYTYLWCGGK